MRTDVVDIPLGVGVEEIEVEEERWTHPNSPQHSQVSGVVLGKVSESAVDSMAEFGLHAARKVFGFGLSFCKG